MTTGCSNDHSLFGVMLPFESAEGVFEEEKKYYPKLAKVAYRTIPAEGLVL